MKTLLVLLISVSAIIGIGAYWSTHSATKPEVNYLTAPVERGSLAETVGASGVLQPHEIVVIGSSIPGEVVKIFPDADVNHTVHTGDPLIQLDDRLAQQKLEQAKGAVASAQAEVERVMSLREAANIEWQRQRELMDKNVGFRRELDKAEAVLKSADAGIKAAQAKVSEAQSAQKLAQLGVDFMLIRVPTTGDKGAIKKQYTILERKVVLGQLVAPQAATQLFTLASDLSKLQVTAHVSENDIGKVKMGQPVTFTVYAHNGEEDHFDGTVTEIRPMPSNLRGAVYYETLIEVANPKDAKTGEWKLRPGMTATVDIVLRKHPHAWKLPTQALAFHIEERDQSEAAKVKLARGGPDGWQTVWVLDAHNQPMPVFVRTVGKDKDDSGIADSQFTEVLEWDPALEPKPDPSKPATLPKVIIGGGPVHKKGLFNMPSVKLP